MILKFSLPVIAVLAALSAQAEIINYTFSGVMKGASPNSSSSSNVKVDDTFALTFTIDTDAAPISRGPQYGTTNVNGINVLSSSLTITNSVSSAVTVDLQPTTGTLYLSHVHTPFFGDAYDSFTFSASLPENTYIDQGVPHPTAAWYLTSIGLTLRGDLDTLAMESGGQYPLFPEALTLSDWYDYDAGSQIYGSSFNLTFKQSGYVTKYGMITDASAVVVPEPATYAALFSSVVLAFVVTRRQRR